MAEVEPRLSLTFEADRFTGGDGMMRGRPAARLPPANFQPPTAAWMLGRTPIA